VKNGRGPKQRKKMGGTGIKKKIKKIQPNFFFFWNWGGGGGGDHGHHRSPPPNPSLPVSILLLKELNSQQDKSFINCNSFFNIYCIQSEVVRVLAKPNQTRCHHLNNNHLLHNDKNIRPSAIPLAFGCKKAIKVKEIISSRICRERFTPTKQKN
jgi:hypothetical protein